MSDDAPASAPTTNPPAATHRFLQEGVTYALVEAGQQGLGLLVVPALFVWLTPTDVGYVTGALVASLVANTLGTLGLDFTVLRQYFGWAEAERAALVGRVLLFVSLWSAALFAVTVVAGRFVTDEAWRVATTWGVAGGLLTGVRAIPLAVMRVQGLLKPYAMVVIGGSVVQAAGQIALMWLGWAAPGYLQAIAFAMGASAMLCVWQARSFLAWSRPRAEPVSALWRYTFSVLPANLFNRFVSMADRVTMSFATSVEALGVYGAASRFMTPLKLFSGGFKTALVPALSRGEGAAGGEEEFGHLATLMVLLLLCGGLLVMAGTWFVRLTPWQAQVGMLEQLVGLLVVAQLLAGLVFLLQLRLYYSSRPGLTAYIGAANSAALLLALAGLVPRWGARGAAVAELVAGLVGVATAWILVTRVDRRHALWWKLSALCASCAPTVVAMWWLAPTGRLLVSTASLVAYAVGLVRVARRSRAPLPLGAAG
ncbi:MAG: lipopolysaccharide biosynthesis protein [Vicinamibacterales bacterium]